jgi:hypothetical protein
MTTVTAIDPITEANPNLQTIMSDVAALKRDLSALLHSVKTNVGADARGMIGHLGDEALDAYHTLAAQGQRSAKAIGHQVEERPVMSLLLAFGIGFLGSRLLSR